jgi:hypothetical protein
MDWCRGEFLGLDRCGSCVLADFMFRSKLEFQRGEATIK